MKVETGLSTARLPQLRACSDVLSHSEEKKLILGLNLSFAKKKQIAEPSRFFAEERLQVMRKGGNYCAVEIFFQSFVAFVDRSLGFGERCDLTPRRVP